LLNTLKKAYDSKEEIVIRTVDGVETVGVVASDPTYGALPRQKPITVVEIKTKKFGEPIIDAIAVLAIASVSPYVRQKSAYEE